MAVTAPGKAASKWVTVMTAAAIAGGWSASESAGREHGPNLFRELDVPTLNVARKAVQSALELRETGETERWSVPGIAEGEVTPRRTWRTQSGHWCREYEERLRLASGQAQHSVGTRCRAKDGTWRSQGG